MKGRKKWALVSILVLACAVLSYLILTRVNLNFSRTVGHVEDDLNGVSVYYNGGVNHIQGRNLTADGYNLGLQYQCVEFVKRYYYEHLGHKMPDAYGHAKDFFDPRISSGTLNPRRALLQFSNGSAAKPQVDDLLIFKGYIFNRFGHVAIVSAVSDTAIEITQQNPGPFGSSRESFKLIEEQGNWRIEHDRVLGFLRLPATASAPLPLK